MAAYDYRCECGYSVSVEKEESLYCPRCGRSLSGKKQEQARSKNFSDRSIEATFEVMAEEGAIWSGAR